MGVTMQADFTSVIHFIGSGLAMTDALKVDSEYFNTILETSFGKADEQFNLEAAAMAASGSLDIRHMFEWGTLGVNKGRTNTRPTPNSERARLWKNTLHGGGRTPVLEFTFKPSVAFVPKPTKTDSGMDPEVIASMRDHVFTWKAAVMERGLQVTIAPREAQFLLIPYRKDAYGFRPHDKKRGYILTKSTIFARPGAKVAGNFTSFWLQFWEGRGNEMMEADMFKNIETDFTVELQGGKPRPVRPATTIDVTAATESERKRVAKKTVSKARARRTDDN
jgi:hypothetical protein